MKVDWNYFKFVLVCCWFNIFLFAIKHVTPYFFVIKLVLKPFFVCLRVKTEAKFGLDSSWKQPMCKGVEAVIAREKLKPKWTLWSHVWFGRALKLKPTGPPPFWGHFLVLGPLWTRCTYWSLSDLQMTFMYGNLRSNRFLDHYSRCFWMSQKVRKRDCKGFFDVFCIGFKLPKEMKCQHLLGYKDFLYFTSPSYDSGNIRGFLKFYWNAMFLHGWKFDAKIEHLPLIIGNILRILAKMFACLTASQQKKGVDVFYEILTLLKSKLKFGAALGEFFRNLG